MQREAKPTGNRIVASVCYGLAVVALLAMLFSANSGSVWSDEVFSLEMIKLPYGEMIRQTAADFHPPLYYIILKFLVDAARPLAGGISVTVLAKWVSAIPYALLLLFVATKVRKTWGNLTAAVFSLCVVAMPSLPHYGVEIRMYSWGLLFVTLGYARAYAVMRDGGLRNYVLFALYSLLAAYTHYFACAATAFSHLFLFAWFLARDRSRLKAWLACAAATAVGFLPWVSVVVEHVGKVGDGYWIGPITARSLYSYLAFAFRPDGGGLPARAAFALLPLSYLGVVIWAMRGAKRDPWEKGMLAHAAAGAGVLLLTVLFGIAASLAFRPVFVDRYMFPALGSFWLCFAILLGRPGNGRGRLVRYAVVCAVVLAALVNLRGFVVGESAKKEAFAELETGLIALEEDARIVVNSPHSAICMRALTQKDCYYWREADTDFQAAVVGPITAFHSTEEIQSWLLDGKTVYFVEDLSAPNPSAAGIFDGSGISCTGIGEYRLEWYELKFYRLQTNGAVAGSA